MSAQGKKVLASWGIVALMTVMCGTYVFWTVSGVVTPTLLTWVMLSVALGLSLWTYWSHGKHSRLGNIGNIVDFVAVVLIALTIWLMRSDVEIVFDAFNASCLTVACSIFVSWRLTNQHAIANGLLQLLVTVSILPTVNTIWTTGRNTEAFLPWTCVWLASLLMFVPARIDKDKLATLYAFRSLVTASLVLGSMIWLELFPRLPH
ncbi:MAG: hypothetical protein KC925_04210 [Candidatus Doudnabacteria bacterium]|nr:hypothetical protein [Candidatus Doudnabacteria bacterium]MCA9387616.1 hypothetical protein [Candidatus Andersenbacteria bacterium]